MPRNPSCTRCALSRTCNTVCVWGIGPKRAKVMLVAEAPGREEDEQGEPMVGKSGQLLNKTLADVGLKRSEVYITNGVKCVVGSTPIRFPSTPTIAYRRHYEGLLLTLETASGHKLSVTPNHPVLCQRGWVTAERLNEFEDTVYTTPVDGRIPVHPEVHDTPSLAEEIFATLQQFGHSARIVGGVMDFHGDGRESYVDVVGTDSFLGYEGLTSVGEYPSYTPVGLPRKLQGACGSRSSHADALTYGFCAPQGASMSYYTCGLRQFDPFLRCSSTPELSETPIGVRGHRSFAVAPDMDAGSLEASAYDSVTDSDLLGYDFDGLPREVEADQVVNINWSWWSGHVYNFATPEGWYYADGIITHNCRPPKNDFKIAEQAKAPSACFNYLAEEIEAVKPRVIVAIGVPALKALTGKTGIKDNRGHPLQPAQRVRLNGAKLICTWHPSYIIRQGKYAPDKRLADDLRNDLDLAKRIANVEESTAALPENRKKLLLPGYSLRELERALVRVDKTHVVLDGEWTALKDRDFTWPWSKGAEMLSAAISAWRDEDSINTVSFAFPLPKGGKNLLNEFFADKWVSNHHIQADAIWFWWIGIHFRIKHDTMHAAFVLDEEQRRGLEVLSMLYAGISATWKQPKWSTAPRSVAGWQQLLDYGANDTWSTVLLLKALIAQMKSKPEPERTRIWQIYRMMCRAIPSYVEMAHVGMPVSPAKLREVRERVNIEQQEAIQAFATALRTSPQQAFRVATNYNETTKYLKAAYGLEIDSSKAEVLDEISDEYPNVPLIKKIRHPEKLKGTYVDPWLALTEEQQDHAIHAVYSQELVTGRTSATTGFRGGTGQVIPGELKGVIVAPKGYVIIAADMSQVELRLIAWRANERRMREVYNSDDPRMADIHMATGSFFQAYDDFEGLTADKFWNNRMRYMKRYGEWVNDHGEEKWKSPVRQPGKVSNFALAYGLAPDKFQLLLFNQYGIRKTLKEATKLHHLHFELWEDLPKWHAEANRRYMEGSVVSFLGRYRRHLKDRNVWLNSPVQADGSDIVQDAQATIQRKLRKNKLDAWLCGESHDCILTLSHEDIARQVAEEIIRPAMEHPRFEKFGIYDVPVPFVADIKIGRSWGG